MRKVVTLILSALAVAFVAPFAANTGAQSGFQIQTNFITGLNRPTAMAFAPDGRLFITEQGGTVRIMTTSNQLLSTPFVSLSGVTNDQERGLLGIAFDPQFTINNYIYLFYTPGAFSRLSRITANGNVAVANSLVTLFEYGNFSGNHRGGDIHFGPDGYLYLALGEAGEPTNSQSVTSYDGKILRLNKADGSAAPGNPTTFRNTSGTTLTPAGGFQRIWAIGLRNPYRFSFQDGTGTMRINDVGAGAFEEVNNGIAGSNYGWPTCEGQCSNSFARNPIYTHIRGVDPLDGCAITGGAWQSGGMFPATYANDYFIIDYCRTWVKNIRVDDSFQVLPFTIPSDSADLKFAPDGSLLVAGNGSGTISRISYVGTGGNRNPVANGTATPTSGPTPLTVAFSSAGSSDPDGDAMTFSWAFGDGTTAIGATASKTYSTPGTYTATLTASDGRGGLGTKTFTIAAGRAPTPTITTPAAGSTYAAGDTIAFAGTATDTEDGTLPASAFSWTVTFHHDAHIHPALGPIDGTRSGSFLVPPTGHTEDTVFYRVALTVRDSSGLTTTVTRDVQPRKSRITLTSTVAGARVLLDGQPFTTPYTFTSVVGIQRAIEAPSPQTIGGQSYQFNGWSDGGARSHVITAPASDQTYTADLRTAVPAPTASITATLNGTTATVNWSTTNAVSARINGAVVALSGTQTITISATTTFTLVATNSAGVTATQSATVTLTTVPAPTATISATLSGTTATVNWSTTNAVSARINGQTVALSGTQTLTISATTTFTLVATNSAGVTATRSATVTLAPVPAPTATLTATLQNGPAALVTWSTTNAATVTINGAGVGPSGTQTVPLTATTTFTLVATNSAGVSVTRTATVTVTATPVPNPPTNLAASVTGSRVTISWRSATSGPSPTQYLIYAGTIPGASNLANGIAIGGLSVAVDLPRGRYYVRVRAANATGVSADSNEATFKVGRNLRTPSGFSVLWRGNVATLTWTETAGDGTIEDRPTGYVLEAGTAQGTTDVGTLPLGNVTSFSAAIPPGAYYVRVRAVNDFGDSDPTEDIRLTPPGAPGAPASLVAFNSATLVELRWTAPEGAAPSHYVLEVGSAPGLSDLVVAAIGNVTRFTAPAPPAGTYYVRVKAVNGSGPGAASNEVVIRR